LDHDFDPNYVDFTGDKFKQMSTLHFSYQFEHENDTVFFSHFVPFTYSDLVSHLHTIQADETLWDFVRIDGLCNSFIGNPGYCLTFTSGFTEN
jgi:hypothetical protein